MNIQALASRKAIAIQEIADKLGVDLSVENLPKAPDNKVLELFRLERIANSIQESQEKESGKELEEFLSKLQGIKGIGPSIFEKIEEEMRK